MVGTCARRRKVDPEESGRGRRAFAQADDLGVTRLPGARARISPVGNQGPSRAYTPTPLTDPGVGVRHRAQRSFVSVSQNSQVAVFRCLDCIPAGR